LVWICFSNSSPRRISSNSKAPVRSGYIRSDRTKAS
jgi:hypothetical protein